MAKIEISLEDLQILLNQQKRLVIEKLAGQTSYYNAKSENGYYESLKTNEDKFKEIGFSASYPSDFEVLKKYIK